MEKEEFKEIVCIRKFYMAAKKQDGPYYNKATLTSSIRAAIDSENVLKRRLPIKVA